MQLGNVYADIEIPALELKEFLKPSDCYYISIVESAGAAAPFITASIKTTDIKVKNGINENNKIIIKIGSSPSDADSFEIYPSIVEPNENEMKGVWTVGFGGFIGNKEYRTNFTSEAYSGNSLEVLEKLIKETDKKFKSNVTRVYDNPATWRRINTSFCDFAMNVVLHMNVAPSFPLCAVDKYSNFILKDFNSLSKEEPKYYLTKQKSLLSIVSSLF